MCVANLKLLPKKEVLINEHVYILRGNSTVINQSYLFHCIYSEEVQNQIRNLAYNKSAQPGLNRNHLDLIQIPLPSLQEQQRLAEELDKIQSFTKSAENAITSLKSQWSGSSSLTDSEDYEVVRLGDVCNITSGNSAPQNAESFENGIYSFFRVSDIAKDHHNVNLMDSVDKLNAQGAAKLKLFKKDSILFPKSGASCLLNHRAIMGCDGYVVSHLAVIESQPSRLLSKYLYHLLCNIDAKTLVLNDGYPSVRTEDIGNIQIPLPPLEIQQEIIKEIDEQLEYIKQTEQMIKKQQLKTKEILNQIWQTK